MRVDVILSYRHFWRAIDEVIYVCMPVNVRVRGVGGDVIKGKLKASCRPWNYDMDSEEFCPVS